VRQPIWIINSSILALLILLEGVVFVFHSPASRKVSLKPSAIGQSTAVVTQAIDIEQIYKNDIFNTYVYEAEAGTGLIKNEIPDIPSAPEAVPIHIPEIEQPTFVTPLDVTLKGVMFLADDQLNSVAVVQNNSVKTEANYRVGEFIEDAQVLKMFADKVLVIRSNGQQEMLYLREEDAAQDLQFEDRSTVQSDIVFMIQEGVFSVNVAKFVEKINNLGQFIDMLGLITVYNQGQASGCRVGEVGDQSLGNALGLKEGDVIEKVDGELITNLTSRVAAYNVVVKKSIGDVVSMSIRRGDQQGVFVYHLVNEASAKILADKYAASAATDSDSSLVDTLSRSDYEIEKQRQGILSRKVAMAPTQRQIEEEEMRNLMKASRSGANNYMNT
jgi:type II secretory pathway component PulC